MLLTALAMGQGGKLGRWQTPNGEAVNPLQPKKGQIGVVIFTMSDCPIANAYAPEINRIVAKYTAQGVAFSVVYVDSDLSKKAAKQHAQDYGYKCTQVLDPLHTLAQLAGATTSPEAIVIGAKGTIVYRGRIDNRVAKYGKTRPNPTRQDLRITLDALLSGKPVPVARTPCVGCLISAPPSQK